MIKLQQYIYIRILRRIARAKLYVRGTLSRIPLAHGNILVNLATSSIPEKPLRKIVIETLLDWMKSPEDDFIEYLFHVRQSFLCIEILNLDPQCRALEKQEFSKKRLLLDTNIILHRILNCDEQKHLTKLLDNSLKLGCSLYVTERTVKELNDWFENTRKLFATVNASPKQFLKMNNLAMRNYGQTNLGGIHVSKEDYMDRFSKIDSLLKELGIGVLVGEFEEIKEVPEYQLLIDEVKTCFVKLRYRPKSDYVAENDAFHLLLVKELRKTETSSFLGPNTWFLTRDLTLVCCEKFINQNFNFPDQTSPIMLNGLWNEIMSTFLIGVVEENDLIEVMKSFLVSEFTPIGQYLDAETLAKLDIDWTEYDWLEVEEIQKIVKQKFVLNYLSKREDLYKTDDHEAIAQSRADFNLEFSRLIAKISNRKINQVRTKLEESEQETEGLKQTVKSLVDDRDKLTGRLSSEKSVSLLMRYISGIAGVCLLVYGSILILLMKETVSAHVTGSYVAFLIVGALLLLLAIAPKQVSGTIGLGRKD